LRYANFELISSALALVILFSFGECVLLRTVSVLRSGWDARSWMARRGGGYSTEPVPNLL